MTHKDFHSFFMDSIKHLEDLMESKNHEYAPGDDKLANFKKAAKMTGKTPEECLWLFCSKHLVSVQDIINREAGYTPELLREKCGDVRAYTVLLEALMQERYSCDSQIAT